MARSRNVSFSIRLRDLLSTLEASALLGSADQRVRGLGEQLQFACMALPCDEALVALELNTLGRLQVPGVASAEGWRATELELWPSGTPFAHLLAGGSGFAAEVAPGDNLLEALEPILETQPRHAIFVPIRVGDGVLGGAVLLRSERAHSEEALAMGERLSEVLALTVESFRSERVVLQLFASVLPDLCAEGAPTDFAAGLERYIHGLRLAPAYRRRLELADAVARLANQGGGSARLAIDMIDRLNAYLSELSGDGQADALEFGLDPLEPTR